MHLGRLRNINPSGNGIALKGLNWALLNKKPEKGGLAMHLGLIFRK